MLPMSNCRIECLLFDGGAGQKMMQTRVRRGVVVCLLRSHIVMCLL